MGTIHTADSVSKLARPQARYDEQASSLVEYEGLKSTDEEGRERKERENRPEVGSERRSGSTSVVRDIEQDEGRSGNKEDETVG